MQKEPKKMESEKESVEVSAKTVEEAIEHGLSQLGVTRDQVEVEVVNPGRSGVLGIGAEDAQVRLVVLPDRPPTDAGSARVEEETPTKAPRAEPVTEPTVPDPEIAQTATELLQGLLDLMQVRAQVQTRMGDDLAEEGEDPALILDVTGNDLGILIGRRGETLRALQYMTRLMLSRKLERWEPVVVDVESYLVRRRRSLRQLANRMADRVAFSQQRVVLEAMPPNERRIIHIALRNHPQVTTKSIGEGDNRKVTILPK
jgi:spoIIIJ-associated protein